ncbi:MAG: carbohydrate kinase family protein [Gammaproteobacteria bacterium]|nr:carbohydrate kinase family protein [Gammaproteobacteria bacterium]
MAGMSFRLSPRVCVLGSANVDIHGAAHQPLRLRDSNPGSVHVSPGGVARNVAENLSRLGVDCRLVTAVGKDPHGEMLLAHGREAGIDMRFVQELESAPTSTYLAVLDRCGNMQVAVADMEIMDQLTAARLEPLRNAIGESSLLVIDANLPDDALGWVVNTFPNHDVFADTVSTVKAMRLKPYLGTLHTLKTNPAEAEALTGFEARTGADLDRMADWLHAQGVQRLFLTRAEDGLFYSTGNERGHVTLEQDGDDVTNSTGAGDAFLAALVYARLQDWPLDGTLQFAGAAAQVTVEDRSPSNPALSLTAIERVLKL